MRDLAREVLFGVTRHTKMKFSAGPVELKILTNDAHWLVEDKISKKTLTAPRRLTTKNDICETQFIVN